MYRHSAKAPRDCAHRSASSQCLIAAPHHYVSSQRLLRGAGVYTFMSRCGPPSPCSSTSMLMHTAITGTVVPLCPHRGAAVYRAIPSHQSGRRVEPVGGEISLRTETNRGALFFTPYLPSAIAMSSPCTDTYAQRLAILLRTCTKIRKVRASIWCRQATTVKREVSVQILAPSGPRWRAVVSPCSACFACRF